MEKVIVLTGPTAVGKSKIALKIAQIFNFDIINGDAYQIYKYMDIGTAKPTIGERQKVNHLLFDFLLPTEPFSIFEYQKIVRNEITKQIESNKIPFIVGGSGLYINSVIYDYQFINEPRMNEYDDVSTDELYSKLKSIDPETVVDPNNRKRLERALEIKLNNNSNVNTKNKNVKVYDSLVFFLYDEREILYERINKRVDQMIADGLVDEVKKLYPNHLGKQAAAAIGYKEIISYLNGDLSLDEAISLIKQHTRNYAKRQITWFRHQTDAFWINVNCKTVDEIVLEISNYIENFKH